MVGYKRIAQPLRRQQLGYDARVSLVPVVYNHYFGRVGIHENAIQLRVHVLRLQVAGITLATDFDKAARRPKQALSLTSVSRERTEAGHVRKDRIEAITSVERRRRRIRYSRRSLDSLPRLRPLELRQAA